MWSVNISSSAEGRCVLVKFENHPVIASAPIAFFSDALQHSSGPQVVRIYATMDEATFGRTTSVSNRDICGPIDIVVCDARLDPHNLADMVALAQCGLSRAYVSGLGSTLTTHGPRSVPRPIQESTIMTMYMSSVSADMHTACASWGTEAPRCPALQAVFARAPLPVVQEGRGVITYAGGQIAVALVSASAAYRAVRSRCTCKARRTAVADHPACKRARACILLSSGSPPTGATRVVIDRSAIGPTVLFVGVPVFYVAVRAFDILDYFCTRFVDTLDDFQMESRWSETPSMGDVYQADEERADRVRATQIIINGLNCNLDNIKARLWHPDSRLAKQHLVHMHAQFTPMCNTVHNVITAK